MILQVYLWIHIIKLQCFTFFITSHFQCFQIFVKKVWKSEEENSETQGYYSSGCSLLSRIKRRTHFHGPVTESSSFCRIRVSRRFPTIPPEDGNRFTSRNLVLLFCIPANGKMRIFSNSKRNIPSPEALRIEQHEPYPFNRLLSFSTIK